MSSTPLQELANSVSVALERGDAPAAIAAVAEAWRELSVVDGGGLRDIVSTLPPESWSREPVIALALGASFRSDRAVGASSAIAYFRAVLADEPSSERIHAEALVRLAAALRLIGHLDDADAELDRAVDQIHATRDQGLSWRVGMHAAVAVQRGLLHFHRGRFEEADENLAFADGLAAQHLDIGGRLECVGARAVAAWTRGDLAATDAFLMRADAISAGTRLAATSYAAPAATARYFADVDRLDLEAAAPSGPAARLAAAATDFEPFVRLNDARVHASIGDSVTALDDLRESRAMLLRWRPQGASIGLADQWRSAVLIRAGQGDEAWPALAELSPDAHHNFCPGRYVAELRLRRGDIEGAHRALRACTELADAHAPRTLTDVLVLRGVVEARRGNLDSSALATDRALAAMAGSGSLIPILFVPAPALRELLADAAERRQPDAVRRLLGTIAARLESTEAPAMPEELTAREAAVLDQLRRGLTVAAIASELFVSTNTVKTHLRHVYRKLGVASRTEAVRRADSMGLYQRLTRDSPHDQPSRGRPALL